MLEFIIDGKQVEVENDTNKLSDKELKKLEDKLNKGNEISFKIEG